MKSHKIVFEKWMFLWELTLEYRRILKQKRALKKRVQLPQDWFGTSIWSSFHGQGSQFLFVEEEKVTCLTGKERGGHEMKKFPNPSPLTFPPPPPSKKQERAPPCLSGVRWIRAHVVVGRTASKEWDSGFGLVTRRVSDCLMERFSYDLKKMVSVSVRYLFYQPVDEKIKTWPLRFPAKENPNMEKVLFDWPIHIVLHFHVKVKYRLISRKFSAWSFFTRAFS